MESTSYKVYYQTEEGQEILYNRSPDFKDAEEKCLELQSKHFYFSSNSWSRIWIEEIKKKTISEIVKGESL